MVFISQHARVSNCNQNQRVFTKRLKFLRALAEEGRDQAAFVETNPVPAHWPTGPPEDLLLGIAESE